MFTNTPQPVLVSHTPYAVQQFVAANSHQHAIAQPHQQTSMPQGMRASIDMLCSIVANPSIMQSPQMCPQTMECSPFQTHMSSCGPHNILAQQQQQLQQQQLQQQQLQQQLQQQSPLSLGMSAYSNMPHTNMLPMMGCRTVPNCVAALSSSSSSAPASSAAASVSRLRAGESGPTAFRVPVPSSCSSSASHSSSSSLSSLSHSHSHSSSRERESKEHTGKEQKEHASNTLKRAAPLQSSSSSNNPNPTKKSRTSPKLSSFSPSKQLYSMFQHAHAHARGDENGAKNGPIGNSNQSEAKEKSKGGRKTSRKKGKRNGEAGQGMSCHQCKLKRDESELLFCTSFSSLKTRPDKLKRCLKKYCLVCLENRGYDCQNKEDWVCPSCRGCCTCRNCRQFVKSPRSTKRFAELDEKEEAEA